MTYLGPWSSPEPIAWDEPSSIRYGPRVLASLSEGAVSGPQKCSQDCSRIPALFGASLGVLALLSDPAQGSSPPWVLPDPGVWPSSVTYLRVQPSLAPVRSQGPSPPW